MRIQRAPLADITLGDIETLKAEGSRETAELEFKGDLHVPKGEENKWRTKRQLGEKARDEILSELVAFANTEGGTLILGLHEDDNHQAADIDLIPSCGDLANRLLQAADSVIEPQLPSISAQAIRAEASQEGVIVFRVSKSSRSPHRLKTSGQFYMRRGESCVSMTIREVRDAFFETASSITRLERFFDVEAIGTDYLLRGAMVGANTSRSWGFAVGVAAAPFSEVVIPDLPEDQAFPVWWKKQFVKFSVAGKSFTERTDWYSEYPRIGLRSLKFVHPVFERRLSASGQIVARLARVLMVDEGKVLDGPRGLPIPQIVAMITAALCQVEIVRRTLAAEIEYALEIQINATHESGPVWGENAWLSTGADFKSFRTPSLRIGSREDFDQAVNSLARDIYNQSGKAFGPDSIEVDWDFALKAS